MHACVRACARVCVCVCVCVCVHACVPRMCGYGYVCAHVHAQMHACRAYVYMGLRVCVIMSGFDAFFEFLSFSFFCCTHVLWLLLNP